MAHEDHGRKFKIHEETQFLENKVSTAKYSAIRFLPLFLYEQLFLRYANLFFLVTGSIQTIKEITPTSQLGTLAPLSGILLVSAIKELYEDRKRHTADRRINNSTCLVLRNGTFISLKWRDVRVADVVKVLKGESMPADLILLCSSQDNGQCYIETSQLDGETNLKIRQALPETATYKLADIMAMRGLITSEQPNNSLYTFDANIVLDNNPAKKHALTSKQLLLRGAQLRNTKWVNGIVVFTGHETKLMRNATLGPYQKN